jgi:hypothetical protein
MVPPVDYRQEYFDAVDGYLTARRNGNAAACGLFLDDMKKARVAAHEAGFREQMEEIWCLPPSTKPCLVT